MPGSGRSPFLHKELHFQRKAPAPSTGGASSSLRFKRGLEECRAFPAAITLSYSDTDDSSCWEQALFPSLCSALCTSQSLFHPVPFRQRPASISCCQLGSAGLLSFPQDRQGEGDKGSRSPEEIPRAAVRHGAWERLGEKGQFSPRCPPTWPSRAQRIRCRVGEECGAMKTNTGW